MNQQRRRTPPDFNRNQRPPDRHADRSSGPPRDRRQPDRRQPYQQQQQQGLPRHNRRHQERQQPDTSSSRIFVPRNPHEEIPPAGRRTLILSHVPPTISYMSIRNHFNALSLPCDFCTVDKARGEAYVKFRERGDVLRVWEGGDGNLDGHGGGEISLVEAGVRMKAIHYTNQVAWFGDRPQHGDRQQQQQPQQQQFGDRSHQQHFDGRTQQQQFERKRSFEGQPNGRGGRGPGGRGGQPYNAGMTSPNKRPRYDDDYGTPQDYDNGQNYDERYNSQWQEGSGGNSLQRSSREGLYGGDGNAPNTNSGSRGDTSNPHDSAPDDQDPSKQPPIQLQSAASPHPSQKAWRRTPPNPALTALTAQISTLTQKLSLLHQQETTLQKQLTLQKKMLSVLQSKNSPKDEVSKKMKEILSASTKVTKLKKERMEGMKELDGLKEKKREMVETRREGWGKKSLDRRTTVLKVEGFDVEDGNVESMRESIEEHFSTFGSIVNVSVECSDGDDEEAKSSYALVKFANRADAEKARTSDTKFNEITISCTWHNPPSSTTPTDGSEKADQSIPDGDAPENDDGDGEYDIYNDIYEDAYDEEEGPLQNEEGDGEYAEDDEHLVDYD